jgi:hypothetical protein
MKRKVNFLIVMFSSVCVLAQVPIEDLDKRTNSLTEKVKLLQLENNNLQSEITNLNSRIASIDESIIRIENQNFKDSVTIFNSASQLGVKIQQTERFANNQILQLGGNVEKNRLYWIIGTLVTLLIGGLVYWLLGRRIASNQTNVETQIRNTKKSLEEESLKLDAQLLEIINSQLKIKETEPLKTESGEKDHSLVLKVADEVTRILMNLEVMDKEIKGYKQLKKYSESILDNLKAYGYEIPQLIGVNYNSGMNMVATLEFDESIESGKQIIKRIIKPQVNFEGKMIQAAKVTVAFNE